MVAQKWSELSDDDRKAWSLKAEAVCEASLQRDTDTSTGDSIPDSAIIEKALITIQEKVLLSCVCVHAWMCVCVGVCVCVCVSVHTCVCRCVCMCI